jgi:hypothetical protein
LKFYNLITDVLKIFLFGLVRGSFQFIPQSSAVPPAFFIVDILPFPSHINIYLNNRRLERVTEMKYLGIYFDSRLTLYKHIKHIGEKSRTLIYMLSETAELQWGLGHKSLKTVYEGALVPLVTYGAPVWEEAVTKQRLTRKMQSARRLINIKIAKAYRTISYEAYCVMPGVPQEQARFGG